MKKKKTVLEDYKVYRVWYDFTNWTVLKIQSFPNSVRNTISDRMLNLTTEILEELIICIYRKDRVGRLDHINLNVELLRTFWRISLDNKWISVKNYDYICLNMDEFGKMIGGWRKDEKNRQSL